MNLSPSELAIKTKRLQKSTRLNGCQLFRKGVICGNVNVQQRFLENPVVTH